MPWKRIALAVIAIAVGCATGADRRDRATKGSVEPAPVVATPVAGVPALRARVRVYADAAYRRQNPGHELALRRAVGAAFAVLQPTIGVELGDLELRTWERQPGEDLESILLELENLDPATDVDWVIGFTGALGHVALDAHQLGQARVLGRHAVVRGLNDAAELKLLDDVLSGMNERDRQALYGRRKRHKELVILLHQLGHTLGAMHAVDPAGIMTTSYETTQAAYERPNAALMAAAVAIRFRARTEPEQEWKAVLDHIHAHPWSGWNEDERARLVAELESRVKSVAEGTAGMPLGSKVRAEDREKFRAAERLSAAGSAPDAWEELEPLLEFYPDEPSVQVLACRLAAATGRDPATLQRLCGRAAELAKNDPEPHLRLAQAYLAAKDASRAQAAAEQSHFRMGWGTPKATPAQRKELAALFKELGAVTRAEAVGKGDAEIEGWARGLRARYGFAPGGPVKPEKETAYVAAIRDLLKLVYDRKFPEAERMAGTVRREFGDAAGVAAALCDLEIRRRKYLAARALCEKAIRRYPDAAWAHYLLGLLDKKDGKRDAALKHLERAIALDPELEHAYQVAVELHGAGAEADQLRKAYQDRFGRPLP